VKKEWELLQFLRHLDVGSVRCINQLMQLKTIYTNLKPKYKLILWVGIVLTIYILYGLNYPKRYFFSCVGIQNKHTSQIIKDPLEPKDIVHTRRYENYSM